MGLATVVDLTVRTSMDRRGHKTALSTTRRRDSLLAEARVTRLLADSAPLVAARIGTVRDTAGLMIAMNRRAVARLPATTTSRAGLVRHVLRVAYMGSDRCI